MNIDGQLRGPRQVLLVGATIIASGYDRPLIPVGCAVIEEDLAVGSRIFSNNHTAPHGLWAAPPRNYNQ
jgi:hypothetical protein